MKLRKEMEEARKKSGVNWQKEALRDIIMISKRVSHKEQSYGKCSTSRPHPHSGVGNGGQGVGKRNGLATTQTQTERSGFCADADLRLVAGAEHHPGWADPGGCPSRGLHQQQWVESPVHSAWQ